MAAALDDLNKSYLEQGFPPVQMRIGVHTGNVVAGSLGSANRLKFTVMGDTVVVSKRLEELDGVEHDFERTACRILVSEATERYLDDGFRRESLGSYLVKGKHEEVAIYRVMS
jgi:adenylate cyclase